MRFLSTIDRNVDDDDDDDDDDDYFEGVNYFSTRGEKMIQFRQNVFAGKPQSRIKAPKDTLCLTNKYYSTPNFY